MHQIIEVNEVDQVQPLQETWNMLLEETPGATFFHTLDWLEVYWQHFGQRQRLRLLLEIDAMGDIVGIVPLVVRQEKTKVGRVRVLTFPLDDWGSYYGPIGPAPRNTLSAAVSHIRATPRDWDVFSLRWLDPKSPLMAAGGTALERAGLAFQARVRATTALIELSGTWESYLAGRGAKWRCNHRRWQRRVAELGTIRHERFRPQARSDQTIDCRWDLYDACIELAARSWQGSATDGTTLSHDAVRDYLRATHEAAVRSGGVDVNLLLADDRPIAFAYNYIRRGSLFALRIGFDPEAGKRGAGSLLWAETIRDSFARGDRLYDMGPGSTDYKRFFSTTFRDVLQLDHYAEWSLRAQLVRWKHVFTDPIYPLPTSFTEEATP